ncbi:MAG: DegV family protein [Solobacterium sp.]|nr:DegV family protein [Solobacterium sp.]
MAVRIVADSSSDLFSFEGIDFRSVPLKIITAEKEFVDEPGIDIDLLVDILRNTTERTSTSCPNVFDWKAAFEGAQEIFALTITSALSGSWAAAAEAAKEYEEEHPGARVHVIDTLSTGPEMRLLAEKLRDLATAGKTFDEMKAEITEYQKHTHLFFALESLRNLARNGRVSPAVAKVTEVLGIRFIGKASDEGKLQQLHIARGRRRTVNKTFEEMKKLGYKGGKVRITHCVSPETVTWLKQEILKEFPEADVIIAPCTGLCSYYAEAGGILVGFEDL